MENAKADGVDQSSEEEFLMNTIFKKISDREKEDILMHLYRSRSVLLLKTHEEQLHQVKAYEFTPPHTLRCVFDASKGLKNGEVTIYLIYNKLRYFFTSSIKIDGKTLELRGDKEFYQLQRRKHSRFFIPHDYPALLNIYVHKKKKVFYTCKIKDVSAGGCKVVYGNPFPLFLEGDLVQAFLKIGKRSPIEIQGEVKHMVASEEGSQIFGVEFMKADISLQNRLFTLMIDFQRDLAERGD